MAQTLAQKLRIKEQMVLLTRNAPTDFERQLVPLPDGVRISTKGSKADQLHWFVQSRAQMEAELNEMLDKLTEGVVCWTYFPKGSSGLKTDLTRDKGWDALMAVPGLQWLSLVSFDATWSAFGFRRAAPEKAERTLLEGRGSTAPKPVDEWIDKTARTVRFPPDLLAELKGKKAERAFLESLSFTNKKEYVEWIVSAKKPETRAQRVSGTVERLAKGWKNPRNI